MMLRDYRYAVGWDRGTRPPDTEYCRCVKASSFRVAAERAAEYSNNVDVIYPPEQDIWLIDEETAEEQCYAVALESTPIYIARRITECAA